MSHEPGEGHTLLSVQFVRKERIKSCEEKRKEKTRRKERKIEFCHFVFYIVVFPSLSSMCTRNEQINFEFFLHSFLSSLARSQPIWSFSGEQKRTPENGNRYEITFVCFSFNWFSYSFCRFSFFSAKRKSLTHFLSSALLCRNSCRCRMQPMSPYGASTSTWTATSHAKWRQNRRSQQPPLGVFCKLLVSANLLSYTFFLASQLAS